MCGRPPLGKGFRGALLKGSGSFMCTASHEGPLWQLSLIMSRPLASKAELSSCRLSCKPHIRRDDIPTTVPHSGRRAPGGRHHSVKTAAKHHAEQRRRPLGPLSPRRVGSPDPTCRTGQNVGFMAAPSGNTPWVANRHSAINNFRASATTITFRMRPPVAPARSRYQRTQRASG